MTVLVIGSLHGSPGATTVSVGLAGCLRDAVVVEADCDGGVLAARLGLPREPGVVTLAADRDSSRGRLARHVQQAVGVSVVVGPESSDHASWLWRSAGPQLADSLRRHDGVVIVDVGRVSPTAPTLELFGETMTLIVARPRPDELAILAARVGALAPDRRPSVVLVGERPYTRADVTAELGCDVLGAVADDPRAVETLWNGGSRRLLARSPFARSIRTLADIVASRLAEHAELRRGPIPDAVTP